MVRDGPAEGDGFTRQPLQRGDQIARHQIGQGRQAGEHRCGARAAVVVFAAVLVDVAGVVRHDDHMPGARAVQRDRDGLRDFQAGTGCQRLVDEVVADMLGQRDAVDGQVDAVVEVCGGGVAEVVQREMHIEGLAGHHLGRQFHIADRQVRVVRHAHRDRPRDQVVGFAELGLLVASVGLEQQEVVAVVVGQVQRQPDALDVAGVLGPGGHRAHIRALRCIDGIQRDVVTAQHVVPREP